MFDLGGGTFDVSNLEVGGGVVEVIAKGGDSHLGVAHIPPPPGPPGPPKIFGAAKS